MSKQNTSSLYYSGQFPSRYAMKVPSNISAVLLCLLYGAVNSQSNESLLCIGNTFVTRLVTVILDRNRESIRINEPNSLGNATQNIGLFVLKNARAYGIWRAQFHGEVQVNCNNVKRPSLAIVKVPIQIADAAFAFDYILPGHLAYGKIIVTSDFLGQIATLEVPLKRGTDDRVLITGIEFYRADDFKISFTGLSFLTRGLSSALWAAYRVVPQIPLQLYRSLALRSVQDYIDNNPLPF
ncbi:uncharacterized protein LOC114828066 [Galendromus occidentalis]|uniref:Uncharacterized protein LOC114828066 n=1 Tax=Galendromus occidentalis TaxID=34638 RepID=A0AAJ7SD53_9ACAR|nr:uncharacterized protein LOC114828066 [Galendromus occidentalis]